MDFPCWLHALAALASSIFPVRLKHSPWLHALAALASSIFPVRLKHSPWLHTLAVLASSTDLQLNLFPKAFQDCRRGCSVVLFPIWIRLNGLKVASVCYLGHTLFE